MARGQSWRHGRGWKRFEPAEEWLAAAQKAYAAELQAKTQPASLSPRSALSAAQSDRLFQEFLEVEEIAAEPLKRSREIPVLFG